VSYVVFARTIDFAAIFPLTRAVAALIVSSPRTGAVQPTAIGQYTRRRSVLEVRALRIHSRNIAHCWVSSRREYSQRAYR
jgi:hypothetical protein